MRHTGTPPFGLLAATGLLPFWGLQPLFTRQHRQGLLPSICAQPLAHMVVAGCHSMMACCKQLR